MPWYNSIWFESTYRLSLIIGFLLLIWSTVLNHRITKINAAQRDLNLVPAMTFYFKPHDENDPDNPHNYDFRIRNIGKNVATSLYIPPIKFTEGKTTFEFKFKLAKKNNTLVEEEERSIQLEYQTNGTSQYHRRYEDFYTYFNPESLENIAIFKEGGSISPTVESERKLTVYFRDILGQPYKTTIGFSPRGVQIDTPPKRIG